MSFSLKTAFYFLAMMLFAVADVHAVVDEPAPPARTTIGECATAFAKLMGAVFAKLKKSPPERLPPSAFIFEPVTGRLLEPDEILKVETQIPNATYWKISDGRHGGPTYRVRVKGEAEAFANKEYRDPNERANDLRAFARLKEEAALSRSSVEIATAQPTGNVSMRIQDVQGVDLWNAVWLREDFSAPMKKQLIRDWNQFVEAVSKNLGPGERLSRFTDLHGLKSVQFTVIKDGVATKVWLRPDNAIVEIGTGRVIIVDPH